MIRNIENRRRNDYAGHLSALRNPRVEASVFSMYNLDRLLRFQPGSWKEFGVLNVAVNAVCPTALSQPLHQQSAGEFPLFPLALVPVLTSFP